MTNMNENVIIGDFFHLKNDQTKLKVCLYKTFIEISDKKFSLNDFIGFYIEESYLSNDPTVTLALSFYPKLENNKRRRVSYELQFKKFKTKSQNLSFVSKFKDAFDRVTKSDNSKPFLVFLNPNSGSGKAIKLFFNQIVPMWKEMNIKFKVIDTLYANHAKELIKQIDLEKYRGIIVISGDGLVYEIFNGLLSRSDWQKSKAIPVGQIAAGSANGFSSSIARLCGECFQFDKIENFASVMSFVFAKSKPIQMDLVSVQLENRIFINSFLNIEWAMVADVDYESEQFRFLGGSRFVIGALRRVINLRRYKGRVSFMPADDYINYCPKDPNVNILKNTNNYSDKFLERQRLKNTELNFEYKYLKPLEEKVPNDWLTIEDDFVLFCAVNLPLMGTDLIISPDTKLDDGCMMLTYVRAGVPRLRVLQLFDDAAKGKFLENPYIEFVKVKAFRLEPLDDHKQGNIMIDGEKVHYGSLQAEVLPQFVRALANP
ncbi:unnamed protein product [Brachionus calyciflorus]|uniref:DAGKc domain-containing protein n=1 Tax=Brachionus calyciflorus TaxID=104777 RepID=A0A813MBQ4_9BILA|nr:unnamed protein product [Brachionus calyciflorus]